MSGADMCVECGPWDTEGGEVACQVCGTVDLAKSAALNLRDTVDGYTVGGGFRPFGNSGTAKDQQREAAERRFKDLMGRKAIDWLFTQPNILGLPSRNNPLGEADPSNPFVKSVMAFYFQIRKADSLQAEADGKQHTGETVNADTKRVGYHLAVAIRFAAIQNNLRLAYNKLGNAGKETLPKAIEGVRPAVDMVIPIPYPKDMIANMLSSNPEHINPIGDVKVLLRVYRTHIRLLKRPSDPLYLNLSNFLLVIQRLRAIVDAKTHEDRRPMLCYKQKSNKLYRVWDPDDFDYFKEDALATDKGWDEVFLVSYNLYRAGQCVGILNSKTSYLYAIPLVFTAVSGVVGSIYPYMMPLFAELCAQYGGSGHWTSQKALHSMKRMIIAWSTSFQDAGVQVPSLNLPNRGLVGKGTTGWNGDARRGVPELEMWVVAIKTVAYNWKAIYKARLRTRHGAIAYSVEVAMAQKLFAGVTGDLRVKGRSDTGLSARAKLLKQYADQAAARERSQETSGTTTPSTGHNSDDAEMSLVNEREPHRDPSSNAEDMDRRYEELERRRESTGVAQWIEGEQSSDEENAYDSDDDCIQPALRLKGMGGKTAPAYFGGFTVGPSGLVREAIDAPRDEYLYNVDDYSPMMSRSGSQTSSIGSVSTADRHMRRGKSTSIPPVARLDIPRANRFHSPAVSVSTLHSMGSVPGSTFASTRRSSTDSLSTLAEDDLPVPIVKGKMPNFVPRPSRPVSDMDPARAHIGMLIRELVEYAPEGPRDERRSGKMVSRAVEEYVNEWVEREMAKETIPRKITPAYLASIGLKGKNPLLDPLSSWISAQEHRWSPLECVLRAGIHIRQLPTWMVPHSKLGVMRMLQHQPKLPAFDAIPECPPIPDRYKAAPQTFDKEIRALKDQWDGDVADGFPIFFPAHEMFAVGADADELFSDGEMDMYLADEAEVAERQADKDFMDLIGAMDEGAESPRGRNLELKRKKRQTKKELAASMTAVSSEFLGYQRAMQGGDEEWADTGMQMDMDMDMDMGSDVELQEGEEEDEQMEDSDDDDDGVDWFDESINWAAVARKKAKKRAAEEAERWPAKRRKKATKATVSVIATAKPVPTYRQPITAPATIHEFERQAATYGTGGNPTYQPGSPMPATIQDFLDRVGNQSAQYGPHLPPSIQSSVTLPPTVQPSLSQRSPASSSSQAASRSSSTVPNVSQASVDLPPTIQLRPPQRGGLSPGGSTGAASRSSSTVRDDTYMDSPAIPNPSPLIAPRSMLHLLNPVDSPSTVQVPLPSVPLRTQPNASAGASRAATPLVQRAMSSNPSRTPANAVAGPSRAPSSTLATTGKKTAATTAASGPAKAPAKTTSTATRPSPPPRNIPCVQTRLMELDTRRLNANRREIVLIQVRWMSLRLDMLKGRPASTVETASMRGSDRREIDPEILRNDVNVLKAERDRLVAEIPALKAETKQMKPDYKAVQVEVEAWASKLRIPRRDLGYDYEWKTPKGEFGPTGIEAACKWARRKTN